MKKGNAARPKVLWAIAALLGVASAANLARSTQNADAIPRSDAERMGFASETDFTEISKLLDSGKIKTLGERERKLLEKYGAKEGPSVSFVSATLTNVADDSLALSLIPLASTIRKRQPQEQILAELPAYWRKNGCAKAAQALEASFREAGEMR